MRLGGLRLARQVNADQLGGPLADSASLGGDGAQRFLGQLDGLVDIAFGACRHLFEALLTTQPLEGGFAAHNQVVVTLGGRLDVALGGFAQFVRGELLTQFGDLLGQVLLQLGELGTALFDFASGLGASLFGMLPKVADNLADRGQREVGSSECS